MSLRQLERAVLTAESRCRTVKGGVRRLCPLLLDGRGFCRRQFSLTQGWHGRRGSTDSGHEDHCCYWQTPDETTMFEQVGCCVRREIVDQITARRFQSRAQGLQWERWTTGRSLAAPVVAAPVVGGAGEEEVVQRRTGS